MGAAHENLPHFTVTHYMISNTIADDEGWKWIDNLKNDVCLPSIAFGNPGEELKLTGIIRKKYYPSKPLPTFLHYCQFYRAGELGFQKRRIREDIFDCDFPLFEVPPSDLGTVKYKNRDGEVIIFLTRIILFIYSSIDVSLAAFFLSFLFSLLLSFLIFLNFFLYFRLFVSSLLVYLPLSFYLSLPISLSINFMSNSLVENI